MKKEKNFIDFMMAARKKPKLAKEFLNIKSARKMKAFFVEKGYADISEQDCKKLVEITKNLTPVEVGDVIPFIY
jgi:hypothetical protein